MGSLIHSDSRLSARATRSRWTCAAFPALSSDSAFAFREKLRRPPIDLAFMTVDIGPRLDQKPHPPKVLRLPDLADRDPTDRSSNRRYWGYSGGALIERTGRL
jgi:hypothetical protein